ncbi:S1/P1 nuclease-domain-containing protein [Zopfochytrium polystomum]|nr:S1/P1 nuclease-domain-containing protein [Zopfochytrium polystomum]
MPSASPFRLKAIAAALTLASAASVDYVRAWGDTLAHPTTGELAQLLLSANGKKLVSAVVDSTFSGTLGGQTANWADTWRTTHKETAGWHFVDMVAAPPANCGYTPSDCGTTCIIAAITNQTNVLLGNGCAASTASTQALQFLAHFIGDVTQPLHDCARDVGGNSDTVTYNGASTNFHAIHDTSIPASRAAEVGVSTAAAYASFLATTYGANKATYTSSKYIDLFTVDAAGNLVAAINMANDANALDCSKSAFWTLYDKDPSQDFSGAYYTATKLLLEEQIAKAGYRLAAWVNAIADQCYGAATTSTSTTSSTKTTSSTSTKTTSTSSSSAKTSTSTKTTSSSPTPTATTTSAACAHDVCTAGAKLSASCSSCAAAVIAADSYCGSTKWDSTCVDEVFTYCTVTC